jgi:LPS export ABC transporter protein LptC
MKSTALIFLVVLYIIGNTTGCEQRIRPSVVEGITANDMPDQESWDSVIIVSRDGVVSAVIKAGYIAVYNEKKVTLLEESVYVNFFDEDGTITSTLTSDRGEVDDETQDLSGYGNVVIEGDDGTILETEEIHWENATERIFTEVYVKITSPEEIIEGYGLESDAALSNYTIYRVTGQTRVEGQRQNSR